MDKWEIGDKVEYASCDLDTVLDLLGILHSKMIDEQELIGKLSGSPALTARQQPLQSLVIVVQKCLTDVQQDLKNLSNELHNECRNGSVVPAEQNKSREKERE